VNEGPIVFYPCSCSTVIVLYGTEVFFFVGNRVPLHLELAFTRTAILTLAFSVVWGFFHELSTLLCVYLEHTESGSDRSCLVFWREQWSWKAILACTVQEVLLVFYLLYVTFFHYTRKEKVQFTSFIVRIAFVCANGTSGSRLTRHLSATFPLLRDFLHVVFATLLGGSVARLICVS
jgi:hypothetical protein